MPYIPAVSQSGEPHIAPVDVEFVYANIGAHEGFSVHPWLAQAIPAGRNVRQRPGRDGEMLGEPFAYRYGCRLPTAALTCGA